MIVSRLSWFLGKNNILNPSQAGFRKGFSTSDPVVRLKQEAEIASNSGNITVAIMIDFTRAFDLLWLDGLLIKMLNYNIKGTMLNYIKNLLTNRRNTVKIGKCFSFEYTCDNGTPQGSSLSPLLFLIMVNDFPKLSKFTSDAFFADDCTIWRSGKNINQIILHLQQDLSTIGMWCKKWVLKINVDKTSGIIFTRKNINVNSIKLKIDNNLIIFKNSCKLLGVFFDSRLTWKPHIDHIVDKSVKGLNLMRCISGSVWGADKKVFLIIYKAIILSHLDYCCFAYSNASLSQINRLV